MRSISLLNRSPNVSRIFLCSVLVWTLAVRPLHAETCEDQVALQPGVATVGGVQGTWLSQRDANRVFFVLGTCVPAYRKLIERQEAAAVLQTRLVQTSSLAIETARDIMLSERERGDVWKHAYQEEHGLRMNEQTLTHAPVLWFALGVLLAGSIAVGVAFGLKKAEAI